MTPSGSVRLRPPTASDASALARLLTANRGFLEPFEPLRSDDHFTTAGQRLRIDARLADEAVGRGLLRLIVSGGALAGTISVSNVVGWPFRSASVGYWVDRSVNGRGIATAAVGAAVGEAAECLGVRRLEAGTLLGNVGSQRALLRNGFRPIGVAPRYLEIAGAFRDHVLFQRLLDEPPAGRQAPAELAITGSETRRGVVLVGHVEGRPAGRALLARGRGGTTRLDVRVSRDARRRGVGSALVRAALAHAESAGTRRVEATTALGDAAGLALLLGCGFAAEGVLDAGCADGRVVLARTLDACG